MAEAKKEEKSIEDIFYRRFFLYILNRHD